MEAFMQVLIVLVVGVAVIGLVGLAIALIVALLPFLLPVGFILFLCWVSAQMQ